MKKIKSFNNFRINEDVNEVDALDVESEFDTEIEHDEKSGKIELYRLVAVGEGEHLVVDTENPGKYYFRNEEDANTDVLSKQGKEYHVIKVVTDGSNIDDAASKAESEKHGCECVVLKDESKAEIQNIEPFK